MKAEIEAADALLFVTAEHSRSIPAVLKNAIDWGARPYGKNSWTGKPAAVTGTTSGAISTAVAQTHLRAVLNSGVGMHVLGGEAYIQFKPELIDADRHRHRRWRAQVPQRLHRPVRRLRAPASRRSGPPPRPEPAHRVRDTDSEKGQNCMSIRPVKRIVQSKPTIEGAGVKLRRAFGFGETAEIDPFLLLDDFRNDQPGRLSRRLPLASAPRHRDRSPMSWTARSSTATASATRHARRRRRAVDDRRARHHASGDAAGRRAGPHARLPALGQPAAPR